MPFLAGVGDSSLFAGLVGWRGGFGFFGGGCCLLRRRYLGGFGSRLLAMAEEDWRIKAGIIAAGVLVLLLACTPAR